MLNKFSCGLFTSNIKTGQVHYANDYLCGVLDYKHGVVNQLSLTQLFSKASLIFLESYLYPMLIKEHESFEIQLTLLKKNHDPIPVVANVNLQGEEVFWSIFTAVNRDKLYQELLDARHQLEQQTEILAQQATTDPLTSLLNRRAAIEGIEKLMSHASRSSSWLSFAMIDIDYFKRINDQLGHAKGDEVLVNVGHVLQDMCRKTDVVARWGGEEFLIVLYDAPFDNVQEFCRRLHQKLNEITVFNSPLTVSVGGIVCHLENKKIIDFEAVLNEADSLLFKAKNNGRNRTELAVCLN